MSSLFAFSFFTLLGGRESDTVAELAATRKEAKYWIDSHFQPIAFESHGPRNASTISFFKELRRRILQQSDDDRETLFLFQRLSVLSRCAPIIYSSFWQTFWLPQMTRTSSHSTGWF